MIHLSKSILALSILSIMVVGCVTSTARDCPAFFHPVYETWAQQGVGKALTFVDQNGVIETFVITEIEFNKPFRTRDFGSNESNISCNLTVRELLTRNNSNETILKLFAHGEFSDRDLPAENLFLRIDVSTGSEEQRLYDFNIDLRERTSSINTGISEQISHSELDIAGVLYQDVITDEILGERFLADPMQVRFVAIASGFGLVQYTRVNGSIFSRVP